MEVLINTIDQLDRAIGDLVELGQEEVVHHWDMLNFHNKDKITSELGHHAPRVRVRPGGSITIIWELWPYRKNKKVRVTDQIRPVKSGYTKRCFKKARSWELDLIMHTETQLAPIRRSLELLRETRSALSREVMKIQKLENGEDHA
jgi:hypothetical protein